MTTKKAPAPAPAPEEKTPEAPAEKEASAEEVAEPTTAELMAVIADLQKKLQVVEDRADTAGLPAPQAVHRGPKEPVTFKTKKGNMRTDR